jgi:DNA-directed RNA polymerase specialized sigma24 family protein
VLYLAEDSLLSGYGLLLEATVEGRPNELKNVESCFRILRRAIPQRVIARRNELIAQKRGGFGLSPLDVPNPDALDRPLPRRIDLDEVDFFDLGVSESHLMFIARDTVDHFISRLNPEQARIVKLKLEGHSNQSVAQILGVCDRTIRRQLEEIWNLWCTAKIDQSED